MVFSRKLAVKLSYLVWEVPGTPQAPPSSSTLGAHSCTRPPPYTILLQLFLLIYPLGKLCYGLVASYRSTGARRSGMSHGWCALCSLDFCWRGSGTQENPSHRDTLPDDSVKKARDKAVTPNWPSWPEAGQTHAGSSWAGTFLSGQSKQPALPLNQKTCKVLSPVHAKDPFLRRLLVLAFMWLQPQSCPF